MACCVAIAYLFGLILRPVRKWVERRSAGAALPTATYGSYGRRNNVSSAELDRARG